MKKSGKCPKCGSRKIYKIENGCIQPREFVEVGILHSIPVTRHICTECGYVEEWVEPPSRLKELVQRKRTEWSGSSE